MVGLGKLYWTYYQKSLKVLELDALLFKVKSYALQPAKNDLGHPWTVGTFKSLPFDMLYAYTLVPILSLRPVSSLEPQRITLNLP